MSSLTSGLTGQFPAGVGFANPNPMPQTALIVNNSTVGVCICVTTGSCALAGGGTSTGGSTDGSGLIDVRILSVSIFNLFYRPLMSKMKYKQIMSML